MRKREGKEGEKRGKRGEERAKRGKEGEKRENNRGWDVRRVGKERGSEGKR